MLQRRRRIPQLLHGLVACSIFFVVPTSGQIPVPPPVAPLAWWNDVTDVTLGIWARANTGRLGEWTVVVARGFGRTQSATLGESLDFSVDVTDPGFLTQGGFSGSLSGWAMDGTVGARFRLSAPRINGDSRHETGFRAIWVATRETAYLDPLLWDNAGSVEGGVFHSRSHRDGNLIVALRAEGVGGVAYRHGEANSGGQYEQQGFGRFTGELSVRRRFGPFVAGVRGYAGAFLSADPPPAQRAIPVSGADPYQTLSNPWIRSEGALLSGGDVFYQAPGHANLRGYRPGASGRWVGSVNLELEGDLYRADRGVLRRASLLGFWDGGLADTLVVRSFEGRAYRILVDGGVGARVWLAIGALHFPIRIEFPLYVSEPAISLDRDRTVEFVDFRWLISVQPIF